MPVIDASLYIALINSHEAAHASSWDWFEEAKRADEPVLAPVILLAEVAAALSRGLDDPGLARQVIRQLEKSSVIELVPVTQALAKRAASIAVEARIRGCDAVYVALADQLDDRLVTLDRQQLERVRAIIEVWTPHQP